jgi:Na+-transporting NADH:ubiquinone oxidoreductase subunit C
MGSDTAPRGRGWLRRLRDAPRDSPARTVAFALSVCLVCSLVVSVAAVALRPLQIANREQVRRRHVAAILTAVPGIETLIGSLDVDDLEVRIVDLDSGMYVDGIDPADYDQRAAAADPTRSIALSPERDPAGIGRRENLAAVYVVRNGQAVELFILPVYGSGYLSTLYGYVALSADTETILGLTFYEHDETPGLGSQIEDPRWLAQWKGKRVRDESGRIRIRVVAGAADPDSAGYPYEVDAISGATMTGDGVTNLLRFWLGADGFGPYLSRMRAAREQ